MKRAVITLLILVAVGGFAFANGEKEEIGDTADSVATLGVSIEEAVDNSVQPMDRPAMIVVNTTRYNFIDILDDKKDLLLEKS